MYRQQLFIHCLSLLPRDRIVEICHEQTMVIHCIVICCWSRSQPGSSPGYQLILQIVLVYIPQPFIVLPRAIAMSRSAEAPESTDMQKHSKESLGLYIESLAYISTSPIFIKVILLQYCRRLFLPLSLGISYIKFLEEELRYPLLQQKALGSLSKLCTIMPPKCCIK